MFHKIMWTQKAKLGDYTMENAKIKEMNIHPNFKIQLQEKKDGN